MTDESHTETASDIRRGDWIDRRVPGAVRPYFRLARVDRAIGTWLLLIPCWWGLALATTGVLGPHPLTSLWYSVLFAVGAFVMRGAGCTWNDILDRDFDARVARTATRPIPSGAVSVPQAVLFLLLQLLVGLAVLLFFNTFTVVLAVASLVLVATYPLMKRITYWPQAFLGLTFNWGALVGWAAVTGSLETPALLLYAAGFFWTLGYDTIYAHQDKEDDALIGVKSTALKLGAKTRPWLWLFYGAAIALLAAAFWTAGLRWTAYPLLALAAYQLATQAARVDFDDPQDCRAKFDSNRYVGLVVLFAILAGGLPLG
ncbi:MAG: 4-hydroxybenzoate octaprenyltransferase [Alphaproteobacteria bacterium]|nr:4-hydroxybenzoate octaprenyltransferase [Alphaproteobacteria bacterium]